MDIIFKIAASELGQKEISGPENNPTIVNYAHEAGFTWINDDETPWCSVFINWVALKSGLVRSKKENARSWLLIGNNVDKSPQPGDIVIFWRNSPESWEGHVAIFMGFSINRDQVFCLGGNQGNQVSITAYPSDTILGFRRLTNDGILKIPNKVLKSGDKGDDVKDLQNALKSIGIDCGTSDGIFGTNTEKAVKQIQTMKYGIPIDGVFTKETRDLLIELTKK